VRLTIAIGLLLFAATGRAQEPPKNTQAIIEVKYADVNRLANLLQPMFGNMNIRADSSLHVIGISGPPDLVAAFTAAIQKLDVPLSAEPDVELTVYLISGATQGTGTDDVPQELTSTVKQLHGLFAYKSYKLSDTLVLRGRTGRPFNGAETQTEGVLPGTANLNYHLAYNSLEVSPGDPRTVHINGLGFRLHGPTVTFTTKDNVTTDHTQTPAKIFTDLDVKDGQKTVVGKSSVNSAGDALILVIVPKIVD
jgi:Bacterial type II/III secretion system short domain